METRDTVQVTSYDNNNANETLIFSVKKQARKATLRIIYELSKTSSSTVLVGQVEFMIQFFSLMALIVHNPEILPEPLSSFSTAVSWFDFSSSLVSAIGVENSWILSVSSVSTVTATLFAVLYYADSGHVNSALFVLVGMALRIMSGILYIPILHTFALVGKTYAADGADMIARLSAVAVAVGCFLALSFFYVLSIFHWNPRTSDATARPHSQMSVIRLLLWTTTVLLSAFLDKEGNNTHLLVWHIAITVIGLTLLHSSFSLQQFYNIKMNSTVTCSDAIFAWFSICQLLTFTLDALMADDSFRTTKQLENATFFGGVLFVIPLTILTSRKYREKLLNKPYGACTNVYQFELKTRYSVYGITHQVHAPPLKVETVYEINRAFHMAVSTFEKSGLICLFHVQFILTNSKQSNAVLLARRTLFDASRRAQSLSTFLLRLRLLSELDHVFDSNIDILRFVRSQASIVNARRNDELCCNGIITYWQMILSGEAELPKLKRSYTSINMHKNAALQGYKTYVHLHQNSVEALRAYAGFLQCVCNDFDEARRVHQNADRLQLSHDKRANKMKDGDEKQDKLDIFDGKSAVIAICTTASNGKVAGEIVTVSVKAADILNENSSYLYGQHMQKYLVPPLSDELLNLVDLYFTTGDDHCFKSVHHTFCKTLDGYLYPIKLSFTLFTEDGNNFLLYLIFSNHIDRFPPDAKYLLVAEDLRIIGRSPSVMFSEQEWNTHNGEMLDKAFLGYDDPKFLEKLKEAGENGLLLEGIRLVLEEHRLEGVEPISYIIWMKVEEADKKSNRGKQATRKSNEYSWQSQQTDSFRELPMNITNNLDALDMSVDAALRTTRKQQTGAANGQVEESGPVSFMGPQMPLEATHHQQILSNPDSTLIATGSNSSMVQVNENDTEDNVEVPEESAQRGSTSTNPNTSLEKRAPQQATSIVRGESEDSFNSNSHEISNYLNNKKRNSRNHSRVRASEEQSQASSGSHARSVKAARRMLQSRSKLLHPVLKLSKRLLILNTAITMIIVFISFLLLQENFSYFIHLLGLINKSGLRRAMISKMALCVATIVALKHTDIEQSLHDIQGWRGDLIGAANTLESLNILMFEQLPLLGGDVGKMIQEELLKLYFLQVNETVPAAGTVTSSTALLYGRAHRLANTSLDEFNFQNTDSYSIATAVLANDGLFFGLNETTRTIAETALETANITNQIRTAMAILGILFISLGLLGVSLTLVLRSHELNVQKEQVLDMVSELSYEQIHDILEGARTRLVEFHGAVDTVDLTTSEAKGRGRAQVSQAKNAIKRDKSKIYYAVGRMSILALIASLYFLFSNLFIDNVLQASMTQATQFANFIGYKRAQAVRLELSIILASMGDTAGYPPVELPFNATWETVLNEVRYFEKLHELQLYGDEDLGLKGLSQGNIIWSENTRQLMYGDACFMAKRELDNERSDLISFEECKQFEGGIMLGGLAPVTSDYIAKVKATIRRMQEEDMSFSEIIKDPGVVNIMEFSNWLLPLLSAGARLSVADTATLNSGIESLSIYFTVAYLVLTILSIFTVIKTEFRRLNDDVHGFRSQLLLIPEHDMHSLPTFKNFLREQVRSI